jgi:multidrug resistance protein, MATE family
MSLRKEFNIIRQLALPVVGTQLAAMMLGIVDMMMLGHFSKEALAASAISRVWVFGTVIIAQGILLGVDPLISQAHGRGEAERVGIATQAGIILALILSVPLALAWVYTDHALLSVGVDSERSALAGSYAIAQIPGIPFYLLFAVQRSWLQGRGIMRPALWVVLISNAFNIVANWALIFGRLGFAEHGVIGAGLATAVTQAFMCLTLFLYIRRFNLTAGAWCAWSRRALGSLREVVRLGLPIGIQFGLEVWAFQIATLMSEELGTDQLAAHSIVLALSSITFMVPLGISIGAATRVGNLVGARRYRRAQVSTRATLVMGAGIMILAALALSLGRDTLPRLFNEDPAVLTAAAAILPIAGAFQLFDGVQVVASGVLRGMGRTRILAVAHFIAFYVLGLPFAAYFTFERGWGLSGIWWGLCLGLAVVALGLVYWVTRRGPASMAVSPETAS